MSLFGSTHSLKEELKSNKMLKGIRANKEVQKSINVIMAIDENNPHDFGNSKEKIKENPCSKFMHNQTPILESFNFTSWMIKLANYCASH